MIDSNDPRVPDDLNRAARVMSDLAARAREEQRGRAASMNIRVSGGGGGFDSPLESAVSDGEHRGDGYWQWAVQYGDGHPVICEGASDPDGETAEQEARATVSGNAMIRSEYPQHPEGRVLRRWVSTGPWIPAP